MKTPFYELAEKIGSKIKSSGWAICWGLDDCDDPIYSEWFGKLFAPSGSEIKEYDQNPMFWAESNYPNYKEDNGFRILLLLFADLLWQDEMKGGGK